MSDTNSLYNDRILVLAAGLKKDDRLETPDVSVQVDSPLCGSRIRVDLTFDGGHISGYGQQVRACALGQGAAAIVRRHAVGETEAGILALRDTMKAMLKENGPVPAGRWSELAVLEPAREHKSRHASIMLPFDALVRGFAEHAEAAGASEKTGS